MQDLLGTSAGENDRLVRGEHRDAGLFQLPLDGEVLVHLAGDSRHRLADHYVEPTVRSGCFCEEVGDAAVASDRDVETFVTCFASAAFQLHASGLDVVEVCDDHP